MPAGEVVRRRVIAGPGQAVVQAEVGSGPDDFGLRQVEEWCMDPEFHALVGAGDGGQTGHVFEGLEERRAAVGVAGVVDGVGADEQIGGADNFGQTQQQGEHDGIAGRHIGDRNLVVCFAVFGHIDGIGQGRTSDRTKVHCDGAVTRCAQGLRHATGSVEFDPVALAVVDSQAMTDEALGPGDGQDRGRVQASGEEDGCDGIL